MKIKNLKQLMTLLALFQFFVSPVFSLTSNGDSINYQLSLEPEISDFSPIFQKGLSYSSWSSDDFATSESDESLELLTQTNSEWISICFSWVQSNTTSHDIHVDPERTATLSSVQHAIIVAHDIGLKVMLKPMVDTLEEEKTQGYPTVWRGKIQPSDTWFDSYSAFINYFADFAEQNEVELFCVGCEFKEASKEKEQWENIISGVRERFSGPITYAADWTNYKNIEWWHSLDYVGIDAYFPLVLFNSNPTFEQLKNAWTSHADDIEEWISTINKPVIITEIGYRSGEGTSMAPSNYWSNMALDLEEQNNCYEAAFQTLWNKSWFYGFYWWTWTHDPANGGLNDSSHVPQNKPVEEIIRTWYSTDRKFAIVDKTFTSAKKSGINEAQTIGFHVSWENDGSDIAEAIVYVNGTAYTTNRTGWIAFTTSYSNVGKRSWIITDLHYPDANGYKVTTESPSIVWDTSVIDIEVDSLTVGVTKIRIKITQESDGTSISKATVLVNEKTCEELENGVYETQLSSWEPYQQLTITSIIGNIEEETRATQVFHIMNIIVYLSIILVTIIMILLLNKLRTRNHK